MKTALYPPGPKARFPWGLSPAFRHDPLGFLQRMASEYGDIAYFKVGPLKIFLLNHPDYIRDVLVTHQTNFIKSRGLQVARRLLGEGLLTSEGNFHQRQRRLVQPAFHRQRLAAYGAVMTEYAAKWRAIWRHGDTLDIAQEMRRLTLAIVGKTLFDADVEAEAEEISQALTVAMRLLSKATTRPFIDWFEKLPLPSNYHFQRARARLDATIYHLINAHRASGKDRGDLLSLLLFAQDEEDEGSHMSDDQVRDEAMTLFLAGYETTANALTWTWYLLSQHPEAETTLHTELDAVLGDRLPTVDDLLRLSYTRMVFSEAMRLYPPAYVIGRQALADCPIGQYVIPAGATVFMSQYVMHHDARYYPDPYRFDPQRWTPEAQAKRPKFAYFPFGGGPRVCIGEPFAWMEGLLIIATLAQRWRMRLVPGHPVVLQPSITLRPKYGICMTLEYAKLS